MSNYLAIATVTATLSQILQVAASDAVDQANVTTERPESAADQAAPDPAINLYLFQATPNPALRNADLPTRSSNGNLVDRPTAALDLHYLLTFYGDESQLEPQRLMGRAISALHTQPIITADDIEKVTDQESPQAVEYLQASDLAEQIESIKVSPLSLDLEETSKLWSVFFQTPYALSVAYQASVVLISADVTAQSALPVRAREVYGTTLRRPTIEKVMSGAGEYEPLVIGDTLLVQGQRLRGDETVVLISGNEADADSVKDDQISLTLVSPATPDEQLRAGVQGVRVAHETMMGDPATAHRGVESNLSSFVLHPQIAASEVPETSTLEVTFDPPVGRSQRTVLLLNESGAPADRTPYAYTFDAPQHNGIDDDEVDETDSIEFDITDVAVGSYLVRGRVDDADSLLEIDTDSDPEAEDTTYNQYVSPLVTINSWLRSASIALTFADPNIEAVVTVQDQLGDAVENASVSITWTLADDTTSDESAATDASGEAAFALDTTAAGAGTYVLAVTDIQKDDQTFDPSNSSLSESLVV